MNSSQKRIVSFIYKKFLSITQQQKLFDEQTILNINENTILVKDYSTHTFNKGELTIEGHFAYIKEPKKLNSTKFYGYSKPMAMIDEKNFILHHNENFLKICSTDDSHPPIMFKIQDKNLKKYIKFDDDHFVSLMHNGDFRIWNVKTGITKFYYENTKNKDLMLSPEFEKISEDKIAFTCEFSKIIEEDSKKQREVKIDNKESSHKEEKQVEKNEDNENSDKEERQQKQDEINKNNQEKQNKLEFEDKTNHFVVKIIDLKKGECINTLEGHSKVVLSLLHLKENVLLSCSLDKTIRMWDLEKNVCTNTFSFDCTGIFNLMNVNDDIVAFIKIENYNSFRRFYLTSYNLVSNNYVKCFLLNEYIDIRTFLRLSPNVFTYLTNQDEFYRMIDEDLTIQ